MFRARGVILRERGLSHLRLNRVEEAYRCFGQAREIFTRSMMLDYLFRLKMHEAEALIRMNKLEEAFSICQEVFSEKNRERNNYCDLFFNTCYYHAAIIKYRQKDFEIAGEFFKKFFAAMRTLCKSILDNKKYDDLVRRNVFEETPANLEIFLENSLIVFEAIYWKDYEFTKYYVQKNLS
jgi:tetratricopeptide (TPR) repeat protein